MYLKDFIETIECGCYCTIYIKKTAETLFREWICSDCIDISTKVTELFDAEIAYIEPDWDEQELYISLK